MLTNMHRNRSVDVHQFAMVPRAEIPRSRFKKPFAHKTTFSAGNLIPIYVDEVLPGDTFQLSATLFARMSTPVFPIMDNLFLETFWFFVPMRLLWVHYDKFFGAQDNPADSTSFTIPTIGLSNATAAFSIYDYMGFPVGSNLTASNATVSALPFRAYNLIWNLWFRDENLQNGVNYGSVPGPSQQLNMDDGPDAQATYAILKRGKRHDYFTGCLPFTQKGTPVSFPLAGNAIVQTSSTENFTGNQTAMLIRTTTNTLPGANTGMQAGVAAAFPQTASGNSTATGAHSYDWYPTNLIANLSTATNSTINSLRLAFATQKVLERDARGGTRYQEKVFAHFGVMGPDARLNRPEYLGGSKQAVNVQPVPQTGPTGTTGSTSPMGTLAAIGHVVSQAHWKQSFTEHGYIIGLASVNADLSYQTGLNRLFTRSTQYDFYLPAFATLGEQAVRNDEIFCNGSGGAAQDGAAFGFQERWAEYRYKPSLISAAFRSNYATPLDTWHLASKYTALPALNAAFIQSDADANVQRVIAAGAAAANEQFIFDGFFDVDCTRAMPLYSVPGFIDRF